MSKLGTVVVVACAVLALTPRVSGQEPPAGARVRVQTSGPDERPLIGRLEQLAEDRLVLRVKDQAEPVVIARADVVKLEVSQGRRVGKGALIGAGCGAAAGAAFAIAVCRPGVDCDPGGYALLFGGTAAGLGAVVGAIAGSGERWRESPARGARVAVAPILSRRKGVAVAVSF